MIYFILCEILLVLDLSIDAVYIDSALTNVVIIQYLRPQGSYFTWVIGWDRAHIFTAANPKWPPFDALAANHKSLKLDQYTCMAYQNVCIEEQNSYQILDFTCLHPTSSHGCFSNMVTAEFAQKGSF